jgi:quinol monooxygenase YgiN
LATFGQYVGPAAYQNKSGRATKALHLWIRRTTVMIFVMGYLQLRPDDIAPMRQPMLDQMAATNALDGCERYHLSLDLKVPGLVWVNERWSTQEALAAHAASDHMAQFNRAMRVAEIQKAAIFRYSHSESPQKLIVVNSAEQPKSGPEMVVVMGAVTFGAGEINRLMNDLAAQMAYTQAEDGCAAYIFSRDVSDPNILHINERWRDDAALEAHLSTPAMAAFNAIIGAASVQAISIKAFSISGSRQLVGAD